ncbi:hypothetical protein MMC26_001552 [Xylographa opegraphella]|nr:hypothetical protein [Xylographa opegraphella]
MSLNLTSPSPSAAANSTKFNINDCTLSTCPIKYAQVHYDPSLAGNALYLTIFIVLLFVHVLLGIRYRTWGFMGSLIGGLVLEIIGYAARVQMHFNPFLSNPFLIYLICLTIGPVFLTAAIYLCLARIIVVYGRQYARFAPRTYTIFFICCDIFSLVLQATGGGMADTARTPAQEQTGINIMIAGLSFQVVSLTLFVLLCFDFAWNVRKARNIGAPLQIISSRARFHGFLYALGLATLTIYIRSCFRVAELQGGFNGSLANEEVPFMILEGAMVTIASITLTVAHPGLIFGKSWGAANIIHGGNRGDGAAKLELNDGSHFRG